MNVVTHEIMVRAAFDSVLNFGTITGGSLSFRRYFIKIAPSQKIPVNKNASIAAISE